MKAAILSFLAVLVAVNAEDHKNITVTPQEIHQLMSETFDVGIKVWRKYGSMQKNDPASQVFNLKSNDVNLTLTSNFKPSLGVTETKSVSSRLTDSAVTGKATIGERWKIADRHAINGTVKGIPYNLDGDLVLWFYVEMKISFGASYDNKSVTLERLNVDAFSVSNPSFKLTGLPFDEDVEKEIISLLSDEYVKATNVRLDLFRRATEEESKTVVKNFKETSKGRNLQEVYDHYSDFVRSGRLEIAINEM